MEREPVILVLEDEFLIASLTSDVLEEKGFGVVTAGSIDAAMRAIDDLGERLSALFLDVHFQDGTTSFPVAWEARRRFPDIPVLYTSGLADNGRDPRRVPDCRFITKPYDCNTVAALLWTMLYDANEDLPAAQQA